MPDDQVTIDPEFEPPPPGEGQGRWLRMVGVVAVGVAAFILGWLLRSPSPAESEPDQVAVTSSTALTGEAVVASTTTRPATTTTTTPEVVELGVPLGEAVPGFVDTITMTQWDEERIDLLRWRAVAARPGGDVLARSGRRHRVVRRVGCFGPLGCTGHLARSPHPSSGAGEHRRAVAGRIRRGG